jgi:release factor glutamine methyltransferase
MTLGYFISRASNRLTEASVPSARLDVLVLLEDCISKDRSWILAHPELEITREQLNKLNRQIKRRESHEPLAYIRGFSEFYGRRFRVNPHVLEPRPESEAMIELLKKLKLPHRPVIADIGTGSGCLGITAALEIPKSKVSMYEIDSGAIAVARHNVHLHELSITIHKRDLLSRPANLYDVILANLPYVPDSWKINKAAKAEPRIAIFGGKDGLDLYRRLFSQLGNLTWKPEFILTEALPPQHEKLSQIAAKHGFNQYKSQDFIQVFRSN